MSEPTPPIPPPEPRPAWESLAPMPASRASHRHPILIGHRGARGLAPENTLAGLRVAADLRLDGVEFDVQRTRDGELVLFHDEDVSRTTDGAGRVADLTLAALKRLDAGAWFDPRFGGERVPTLREALDLLRDTDLLLIVELKEPWRFPGIEAATVALIREYDLVARTQVCSFYHQALHVMHRLDPAIALAELWADRLPADDEATFKTISALHRLFTAENIAQVHRRGQQATAWTVNDLDEARRLMDAGIDGLTTDYPDRLLALFAG